MYKRKIENVLQSWLDNTSHKATTGNAKSMQTVLKHPEKYHVTNALKLGDYNIGRMNQLLTLPMYTAFLLKEV